MFSVDDKFLNRITDIVGKQFCITNPEEMEAYVSEERGLYVGATDLVVKPNSTIQISEIVKVCAEFGINIVPQGGNTGLCGGAVAQKENKEIIIALSRMDKILEVDPTNFSIKVEAGCILADIQAKASQNNCLFPLSLGAEGSCQIGGNLATNAGGINVLRYGNARDLVLGIEVVLPDGSIWNGLRALGKDNTGYALKHLFIGSEGTLGIITSAVLKLFPKPKERQTALCALKSLDDSTALLNLARDLSGDMINAFELIPRIGLEFCLKHIDGATDPLAANQHEWYVLIEASSSRANSQLNLIFENLLEEAFEKNIIVDAVVAQNTMQMDNLWKIRESLPEAQKKEGGSIKHDVSIPVALVPQFIKKATQAVVNAYPGVRPCPFGHVGDGNVHFNVSQAENMDKSLYLSNWQEMNKLVHDIIHEMNGSISAEHGIGILKVDEMAHYKQTVEFDLMKKIKMNIDPKGIMNPGKIIKV
jgi:FAD/FMN-containing dehydrogenase